VKILCVCALVGVLIKLLYEMHGAAIKIKKKVKVFHFAKCALDHQMRNMSLKEFCRPEMNSSLIIRVSP